MISPMHLHCCCHRRMTRHQSPLAQYPAHKHLNRGSLVTSLDLGARRTILEECTWAWTRFINTGKRNIERTVSEGTDRSVRSSKYDVSSASSRTGTIHAFSSKSFSQSIMASVEVSSTIVNAKNGCALIALLSISAAPADPRRTAPNLSSCCFRSILLTKSLSSCE